nr:hypothetical protein pmam_159 [Pithovirus mammoth]
MDEIQVERNHLGNAIVESQYSEEKQDFLIKGKLDKKYAKRFRKRCKRATEVNACAKEKKTLPLTIEAQRRQLNAVIEFLLDDGRPQRDS